MRKSVPPGGVLEGIQPPLFAIIFEQRGKTRSRFAPQWLSSLAVALSFATAGVVTTPLAFCASADGLDFPDNGDLELVGRAVKKNAELRASGRWPFADGYYPEPVGMIFDLGSRTPRFQWPKRTTNNANGFDEVTALAVPEGAAGSATNISRDGETIVGYLEFGTSTPHQAFLWSEAGGLVNLGSLPPASTSQFSAAHDVSGDGSVVVGSSAIESATGAEHAFRWTQATGMVDLSTAAGVGVDSSGYNFMSRAYGVSGDGSVTVGQSSYPPPDQFSLAPRRAFRWTQAGGFQDIAPVDGSIAASVSADGAFVVGRSQNRAFRWSQAAGLEDLGVLAGDTSSSATGVSDDGSIVVGISSTSGFDNNGVNGALRYYATSRAFYWTATSGMQDLTQLLVAAGVDMTGRQLVAAVGISPDGRWISAVTTRPDPEFPTLFLDKVPVLVSLTETLPPPSRLANLSTRGQVLTGENVLIPGFVITGSGNKRLLIRAVGPTLTDFGVSGTLADPVMTLKRTIGTVTTDMASNDNWGTNTDAAEIATTTTALGAFDLPAGSVDAALLVDLEPGQYSVVTQGVSGGTGVAIAEIYDGDSPSAASRLANISTRGFVGTGESIMIPGYVVSAESSLSLLVRAVGPTLGTFGVSGTLSDPQLTIRRDNGDGTTTVVASNDNWGSVATSPGVAAAATTAGAFELNNGSKDAALVVQLLPGVYTVQASGVGSATGVALVEIYAAE